MLCSPGLSLPLNKHEDSLRMAGLDVKIIGYTCMVMCTVNVRCRMDEIFTLLLNGSSCCLIIHEVDVFGHILSPSCHRLIWKHFFYQKFHATSISEFPCGGHARTSSKDSDKNDVTSVQESESESVTFRYDSSEPVTSWCVWREDRETERLCLPLN